MNFARRQWLPWISVSILAASCAMLAFLQYRWTGQITEAERVSLYTELRTRLASVSRGLNDEVSEALAALQPPRGEIESMGRQAAYSAEYLRGAKGRRLFRRIALAIPHANNSLELLNLDLATGQFTPAEWPASWRALRGRLERMVTGGRGRGRGGFEGGGFEEDAVLELPRFEGGREQEWLIAELNTDSIRNAVLPDLLTRYLAQGGPLDYDIDVVAPGPEPRLIFSSSPAHAAVLSTNADAATPLLDVRAGMPGGRRGPPPNFDRGGGRPPQWLLLARHRAGSLEALVAQTRRRNLAISGAVLLLILGTVAMLVRLSRQAERLAELQLGFVAGISHELRTPLTVIRTCAYNLRSPAFRDRPEQVARYGKLIETESAKLEALVEQVLRFSSAEAGHAVRARAPVAIGQLVEEELEARREALENDHVLVERRIADHIPLIEADEGALRHALRNLLDNALKYGTSGPDTNNWIGVYAESIFEGKNRFAEIRVADHGPGIPDDEQPHIFDPFYRGRRAVEAQVHGTGLGLSLVKKIVNAHGGTVRVKSGPSIGTEFIVRLPAAAAEKS